MKAKITKDHLLNMVVSGIESEVLHHQMGSCITKNSGRLWPLCHLAHQSWSKLHLFYQSILGMFMYLCSHQHNIVVKEKHLGCLCLILRSFYNTQVNLVSTKMFKCSCHLRCSPIWKWITSYCCLSTINIVRYTMDCIWSSELGLLLPPGASSVFACTE